MILGPHLTVTISATARPRPMGEKHNVLLASCGSAEVCVTPPTHVRLNKQS